jgi:hypothetical protein
MTKDERRAAERAAREAERAEMYRNVELVFGQLGQNGERLMQAARDARDRAADHAAAAAEEIAGAARPHMGLAPVSVPAAWATGRTDDALMRVPPSLQRMARRGEIGPAEIKAAGYVHSVIEAAEAGGLAGIDFRRIRVDTSRTAKAPSADSVLGAMALHQQLAATLGERPYAIVRAVCYEGWSVMDVAIAWPSATLGNGGVDDNTRKFIGRTLREALGLVHDRFCRPINSPTFTLIRPGERKSGC